MKEVKDTFDRTVRLTSEKGPTLPTNGKVTKLGTKKTGSHFANKAAPGLSILNSLSPTGRVKRVTNKAAHPPSDDGKEIANFLNNRRNPTSSASNRNADTTVGVGGGAFSTPLTLFAVDMLSLIEDLRIMGDALLILGKLTTV